MRLLENLRCSRLFFEEIEIPEAGLRGSASRGDLLGAHGAAAQESLLFAERAGAPWGFLNMLMYILLSLLFNF